VQNKVIISCAITGAMHTPTMSDALPVTPAQIAAKSIAAAQAGAAVIHLHARNPADGEPTGSVLAAGRHQMPFVTQAALLGGNVRVGLEDSIFIERGRLAKSNAEQIEKIVRILREWGREPASPEEARAMLGLKGRSHVQL
jgi:uncharacterized protein (DUF849 family)